jgi:hypothetical protein
MSLVFTPCAGVVEVKREWCGEESFFTLKVDGQAIRGISTGVEIEMAGNYQFLHTVNNFIYFYAFGDRVGTINVTGLGFVKACGSNKGELLQLYDYYIDKRAAANGKKSATLTISSGTGGTKTFRGFLTGMRMDIRATEAMGTVGYWTFRFEVVPTTNSGGSGRGGFTYGFGTGMASSGAGAVTVGP